MAENIEKRRRKGLTTAFMATIIATSLVLFTAGIIATLFISVNDAIDNVKEKFAVDIFLNPTSETAIQDSIIPVIQSFPEVKSVVYISPDEAKQIMIDLNGEDFFSVLDNNPIPPSVQVKFHANFINEQALSLFELKVIDTFGEQISEVSRQKNIQSEALKNINKIMLVLIGTGVLFLFIVLVLVNITFRLSVYSKRDIIKTMQMVGAKKGYIRKPFILQGFFIGLISSIIAIALLFVTIKQLNGNMVEILPAISMEKLAILFIFVATLGIFIGIISTWFAVNRYLKAKIVDLL
ncbi:MAG TPA: permease-like cell division protein FtsX [Bacteroidia bacterium]